MADCDDLFEKATRDDPKMAKPYQVKQLLVVIGTLSEK